MNTEQRAIYNAYRDKKTPYQISQLMDISEERVREILGGMRLGRSDAEDSHTLSCHRHVIEECIWTKEHREDAELGWV